MNKEKLKGSVFVALGASSYGMLSTCVKMAYQQGFTTAEVTISQYILGTVILLGLNLIKKKHSILISAAQKKSGKLKLILAGSSLGLTSVFYYLAVQYVSVSVGIILLMQTVWMGIFLEAIIQKKSPGLKSILSVLIILLGTILATSLYKENVSIDWKGIGWGLMAAISYTATMYSSNSIGLDIPPLKRSLYLITGGLLIILLIFHSHLKTEFSFSIFPKWGIILSLFGTVLPSILLTRGMPKTGVGLGAIVASLEIPVSVFMAWVLIGESVSLLQWAGILLIILAVIIINIKKPT
jgi:drug/metabolite transporter (DMT)-like permease